MIFTYEDTGLWISGGRGRAYFMGRLCNLLRKIGASDLADEMEQTDDETTINEAVDILQEHTSGNLEWVYDGEDLILVPQYENFES